MNKLMLLLENLLKAVVIAANGAMLLLVFGQVISRYVFSYTPYWGEELARYMFVWVVFLSLPLVAKRGGHMCIEAVTNRCGGLPLKVLRTAGGIFSVAFLSVMVWQGYVMMSRVSFQTSPALQIPMSYVYSVIPFGCFVMLLYTLASLLETLRTPSSQMKRAHSGGDD